jgi:hypothetical protein
MKHSRLPNEVILFSGLEQTCYLLTKVQSMRGAAPLFFALICMEI